MNLQTDTKYQQEWSLDLIKKKMPQWIKQKGMRRCWPAEAREARDWAIENYPLKLSKGRVLVDAWPAKKTDKWEHRVVWYGIVPSTGTIIGCCGKAYFRSLSYWDLSGDQDPKFWRFAAPTLVTERRIGEFRAGLDRLKRIHRDNSEAEQAGLVQYKIPIALSDYGKRPTVINFMVERYVHCYSYRIHVFKEYPHKQTGELSLRPTPRVFAWRKHQCDRAFSALYKLLDIMIGLKKEKEAQKQKQLEDAPGLEGVSIADQVLDDEINYGDE